MKILQVAERTYPAVGGVELHTAMISKKLVERGHEVTLVVFNSLDQRDCGFGITYQKPLLITKPRKPSLPEEEYWNGVRILRFPSEAQLFSYYWSPRMLCWLLANIKYFDIVHTHCLRFSNNEFTALAHKKCHIPFFLTCHDKLKIDYMGKLACILDQIYRLTVGRLLVHMAEKTIAFDKSYAEECHQLFGLPYEKIRVIPNGVDYEHFSNLPNGDELMRSIGKPSYVILYIGRFIDYKRPDLLITSFKSVLNRFPDSHLLMLGKDYGLLSYCKKLVDKSNLNKNVSFFENASEELKLQSLSIADMCVIPSDYESFGLVALEAQSSGVPVIVSQVGGLSELLIEGKTGLFLKERSTTEIADKIIFLLENESKRKEMKIQAKEHAKKYSWETVADRLLQLYKEASYR